jgi:hypothetical protein
MIVPLPTNPPPKRLVLFVLVWHHAMAIRSLELDKLFILLVPDLVVGVSFPSEPDFVQSSLSIRSKLVCSTIGPLITNPPPKSLIYVVTPWHHTMAIVSFELDHLFILLVPELVVWFEVVGAVSCPDEPDFDQKSLSILSNFVIPM